jgi:hypothetical protein
MKTLREHSLHKAFQYHIENNIPLYENVFRPHSDMNYALFNYAREMYESNLCSSFDLFEVELLESDIGKMGIYENEIVPLDYPMLEEVELNKPKRGGNKKFYVYVKNDKGNVVKVEFGDTSGLTAKIDDPEARKNFSARHNCPEKKDKTTPGYWSCNLPKFGHMVGLKTQGNFFW